jgi:hypothetical protein
MMISRILFARYQSNPNGGAIFRPKIMRQLATSPEEPVDKRSTARFARRVASSATSILPQ